MTDAATPGDGDDGGFLTKAYGLDGADGTARHYAAWAASYEKELAANGYVTPGRCVDALLQVAPDARGPILDLGCGTGLGGLALKARGLEPVDGMDFSPEMLEIAAAHGCYRDLAPGDLGRPLGRDGAYAHAIAAGVISPGHAPAVGMRHALAVVPIGGVFVFSLNDKALQDPSFDAEIAAIADEGLATVAFDAYGDHIPNIGLKARVIALKRLK